MNDLRGSIDKDNLNSCGFCGHFDPNYDENDMIMHYSKDCPMVKNLFNNFFFYDYSYINVIFVL